MIKKPVRISIDIVSNIHRTSKTREVMQSTAWREIIGKILGKIQSDPTKTLGIPITQT